MSQALITKCFTRTTCSMQPKQKKKADKGWKKKSNRQTDGYLDKSDKHGFHQYCYLILTTTTVPTGQNKLGTMKTKIQEKSMWLAQRILTDPRQGTMRNFHLHRRPMHHSSTYKSICLHL